MSCTSPRTVGFHDDGKTLCWSQKQYSKQYPTFQLPCGKCISCRLNYARQWAIRCVHEAKMHPNNCFITLTYSDEHLKSPKLIYSDFQNFMKKLRKLQNEPIGVFVTGEYGEKTKRPHWHAIIFNWEPKDKKPKYKNQREDQIYSSELLTTLWGKGIAEFGSVTMESAGYCARYAAKKLVHGHDHEHQFQPISKKSSKHAIGKKWLEKFWPDIFNLGELILFNGEQVPIPRYYEKWLKKNHPGPWADYMTKTKQQKLDLISKNELIRKEQEDLANSKRIGLKGPQITRLQQEKKIIEQKFKKLQDHLKL